MLRGKIQPRSWWAIGVVLVVAAAAVITGVNRWGNADKVAIRTFFAALGRADVATADDLVIGRVDVTFADQKSSNEKTPISLTGIESQGDRRYGVTYRLGDAEHTASVEAVGERDSVRLDGLVYHVSVDDIVLQGTGANGPHVWPGTFVAGTPYMVAESELVHAEPVEVTVTQDTHVDLGVRVTPTGRAKARQQVAYELMHCGMSRVEPALCPADAGQDIDRWHFHVLEWTITDDSSGHYGGPVTYSYWEREGQGDIVAREHRTQIFMQFDPSGVELAR